MGPYLASVFAHCSTELLSQQTVLLCDQALQDNRPLNIGLTVFWFICLAHLFAFQFSCKFEFSFQCSHNLLPLAIHLVRFHFLSSSFIQFLFQFPHSLYKIVFRSSASILLRLLFAVRSPFSSSDYLTFNREQSEQNEHRLFGLFK